MSFDNGRKRGEDKRLNQVQREVRSKDTNLLTSYFVKYPRKDSSTFAEERTRSDPDVVRPRHIDGTNWANK